MSRFQNSLIALGLNTKIRFINEQIYKIRKDQNQFSEKIKLIFVKKNNCILSLGHCTNDNLHNPKIENMNLKKLEIINLEKGKGTKIENKRESKL